MVCRPGVFPTRQMKEHRAKG